MKLALLQIKHRLHKITSTYALSRQKITLFVLAAIAIPAFLWFVTTQGPLAPVKVTTTTLQTGSLYADVFGVGTVEARHSYTVSPVMTGRISRLLVDQGDSVQAGQLIAEIDPVDLNEKLASSHLTIERASHAIEVNNALLNEAQSRHKTADATYQRYVELHNRHFVSQEMLDARLHDKTAAAAALEAATASLAAARADLKKSATDANGIAKLLRQTHLTSPTSGTVIARHAEPGDMAAAGSPILQIADTQDLWVRTRVDQHQANGLQVGQKALIVLRSLPQTPLTGTVARIDLISDSVTEERIINVSLAPGLAHLGENAEVTIALATIDKANSLPTAAVKLNNQQRGVWLLQNGQARFQAVKTGIATRDGHVQITDGLNPQDEIIVYSQQALHEGSKVKVVHGISKP